MPEDLHHVYSSNKSEALSPASCEFRGAFNSNEISQAFSIKIAFHPTEHTTHSSRSSICVCRARRSVCDPSQGSDSRQESWKSNEAGNASLVLIILFPVITKYQYSSLIYDWSIWRGMIRGSIWNRVFASGVHDSSTRE